MGTYKTISRLIVVICLGLYSSFGHALALSNADIKSYLNQRLDVRIDIITDNPDELDHLEIELTQNAENNVSRYQLKYELVKSDTGSYLKISSSDVVREPVIEFTLDIGWSDGHIVRKYSFLVDPPQN